MTSSRHSPADNVVAVTLSVRGEMPLLQALLDQAIALAGSERRGDGNARALIGFRSVAPDFSALVAQIVEDAYDEAEGQGARVVTVEVAGAMPIDEGWRAWGFVGVEPLAEPARFPVVVAVSPAHREGPIITMTASIRIEQR